MTARRRRNLLEDVLGDVALLVFVLFAVTVAVPYVVYCWARRNWERIKLTLGATTALLMLVGLLYAARLVGPQ